ncbi:Kiwa anti-phage protein KwaB-like domain-containing protein [Kocuria flava]|uniref:Cyclic nucleotide-binding domain-containing protein n=1 Tax=Kocuria flava TaxID=446860 RepID=A0ABQ0X3T0_9MICC|nr:Kiwa anti-phage protein KwaB-like domain-containing protein [Kocuria flava]GEO92153.1 hypothetical protein KFL01_14590 [Kocuria flava]
MADELPSTEGSLQLVVAWRSGKATIGRCIKTADDVEETLRSHAERAVAEMTDPAPYSPDTDMEDNTHLEADPEELFDTSLIETLRQGASLQLATEQELKTKALFCHAAVIGRGDAETIFVKKRSPIQLGKKSVVATLLNNTLDKIETPIFAFDNRYDAIITKSKVYVLDKSSFEGLFKESPAVLAKTTEWVQEVSSVVSMTDGSQEILETVLKRNQHLRKKFQAIMRRPHIQTLTPDTLRSVILSSGYNPTELMDGDNLSVTDTNVKTVLQLLNEDLFIGSFSQEPFAAGSKRHMASKR